MSNALEVDWRSYNQPFRAFGPLLRISDIATKSRQAGYGHYDAKGREALERVAEYAYTFLSQAHAQLGRDGNVCPFVPTSLAKGLFRATAATVSDLDSIEEAMTAIVSVFAKMPPASPPTNVVAEGEQIFKTIIVAFPTVDEASAPTVIDGLQERLKPIFIRAGMMIGQFHPTCPGAGLHNPSFRPFQAPVACLAVRHVTKYDAPFMDQDEYVDGYLRLFGLEGMKRIQAIGARQARIACPSA